MQRMAAWLLAMVLWSAVAHAREGYGRVFPDTLERAGKTLHLVGLGLREKYTFDVFVLGMYTEDGACDPGAMIRDDRVKVLRQEFVRTVSARRLEGETRKVTEPRMPPELTEADRQQAETFIAMMRTEVRDGTVIEMTYVPGEGTRVTQDGRPLGPPLKGKRFQELLWDSYLGPESFCPKTRDQVLRSCRGS
ncbi:MAG TPA: chalcone isomerase family protein [Myxococcota bacterium]|nr:chalcone isomerase family protein [Myxococcota bacterium]HQK50939.1 chalcone isomerase family protein [Myxococcota bacterium]